MDSKERAYPGLLERFESGNVVITAEGYLMELDRRGYNKNGDFIPTAVLDNPDKVEDLTREFVHAGSDVCSAFAYFATKEKLKSAGREPEDFEKLNRTAHEIARKVSHEIARKVAKETGTLFSVGLSKTSVYEPGNEDKHQLCEAQYRDQMAVSAEYGVDFIHVETLWDYGEAAIALKVAKEFNLPAVITLSPCGPGATPKTFDGYELNDALQRLLDDGAACVGLNCARGPKTMIPIIRQLRNDIKGPLACVAIGYHTTKDAMTWYHLRNAETDEQSFPDDISAHYIGNAEARWYGEQLKEIGVEYIGFCCGNSAGYTRELAMCYGRNPPASRYASDHATQKEVVKGFSADRYAEKLAEFIGRTKKK